MTDENFKIINVNGLELKSLKGGFIGYQYDRPTRRRTPKRESVTETAMEPEPIVEPEVVEAPAETAEEDLSGQPQFLLCKKCGTVINVFLNDRNARCCNQLMVPLIENSITDAESN